MSSKKLAKCDKFKQGYSEGWSKLNAKHVKGKITQVEVQDFMNWSLGFLAASQEYLTREINKRRKEER